MVRFSATILPWSQTQKPVATLLKKKHAAINYHRVHEAIAAGTIKVVKEGTQTNLACKLTKLMSGPKMKDLLTIVSCDRSWGQC